MFNVACGNDKIFWGGRVSMILIGFWTVGTNSDVFKLLRFRFWCRGG